MAVIDELALLVTANSSGFAKGVNQASSALGSFAKQFGLTALAIRGLNEVTAKFNEQIQAVGRLNDLAESLGISFENLQGLELIGTQIGADFETIAKAFNRFNKEVAGASDVTKEAADALKRIGLNAKDFTGLDPAESAIKLAKGFDQIKSASARAAIAQDLFGKSGVEIVRVLNLGEKGIRKYIEEAERLGGVSQQQANEIDALGDSIAKLEKQFEFLVRQLVAKVSPALTSVLGGLSNLLAGPGPSELAQRLAGIDKEFRDQVQSINKGIEETRKEGEALLKLQTELVEVAAKLQPGAFLGLAAGGAPARAFFEDTPRRLEETIKAMEGLGESSEKAAEEVKRLEKQVETLLAQGALLAKLRLDAANRFAAVGLAETAAQAREDARAITLDTQLGADNLIRQADAQRQIIENNKILLKQGQSLVEGLREQSKQAIELSKQALKINQFRPNIPNLEATFGTVEQLLKPSIALTTIEDVGRAIVELAKQTEQATRDDIFFGSEENLRERFKLIQDQINKLRRTQLDAGTFIDRPERAEVLDKAAQAVEKIFTEGIKARRAIKGLDNAFQDLGRSTGALPLFNSAEGLNARLEQDPIFRTRLANEQAIANFRIREEQRVAQEANRVQNVQARDEKRRIELAIDARAQGAKSDARVQQALAIQRFQAMREQERLEREANERRIKQEDAILEAARKRMLADPGNAAAAREFDLLRQQIERRRGIRPKDRPPNPPPGEARIDAGAFRDDLKNAEIRALIEADKILAKRQALAAVDPFFEALREKAAEERRKIINEPFPPLPPRLGQGRLDANRADANRVFGARAQGGGIPGFNRPLIPPRREPAPVPELGLQEPVADALARIEKERQARAAETAERIRQIRQREAEEREANRKAGKDAASVVQQIRAREEAQRAERKRLADEILRNQGRQPAAERIEPQAVNDRAILPQILPKLNFRADIDVLAQRAEVQARSLLSVQKEQLTVLKLLLADSTSRAEGNVANFTV